MKMTNEELELAAKYMATSNLGTNMTKVTTVKGIEQAWQKCLNDHTSADVDVEPEMRSWLSDMKRGVRGAYEQWEKVRTKITDLDQLRPYE